MQCWRVSVFIKGVGVGHFGKDNLDQLGVRVTSLSITRGRQETDLYGVPCGYICSVFVPWLREFSIKGDVVRRSPSFRISGQIRKYLQQSEGGLSSYVADM